MKNWTPVLLLLCTASATALAGTPVSAGDLLVDLDAADLAELAEGAPVTAWPNRGTTPSFAPAAASGGPLFQTRGGIPVVRFNNNAAAHCLTNGPAGSVPSTLLGADDWSLEVWAYRESSTGGITMFSWTPREGLANNNGTVMELRYHDGYNAVEHYGADYNLTWGGGRDTPEMSVPAAYGEWHHFAVTREAGGRERLYCDGRIVTEAFRPAMTLQGDGCFTVGGVRRRSDSAWVNGFAGDIGQIRVHAGPLTPDQVLANYLADNARYNRAVSNDAEWTDTGWRDSLPADASRGLWLRASTPFSLTSDLAPLNLRPDTGGLTLGNGATLAFPAYNDILFGYGAGNAFPLAIQHGTLRVQTFNNNANTYLTFGASAGASASVTVGDGTHPAVLASTGGYKLGEHNGAATMTVNPNAAVTAAGRLRMGDNGSTALLAIEAGGAVEVNDFIAGALGGTGFVSVAGALLSTGTVFLGENATGFGELTITADGRAEAYDVRGYDASGFGRLVFDGGTLAARPNAPDVFIRDLDEIIVTARGATVEIPADRAVNVYAPIFEDPASAGGGFCKTGGGELRLTGDSTLSGDYTVLDGALVFLSNAVPASYTGTLLLQNGAAAGYDAVGGAARLLARLDPASEGSLILYGNNAAEDLDLSRFPGLTLQSRGNINQTGAVVPSGNRYVFEPNGTFAYAPAIADLPGAPASVTVRGATDTASVILSGDNAAMSGGITVESGGLSLAHANAAGATGAKDIALAENTTLKLAAALPAGFVQARIADGSRPAQILLTPDSAACDIDASRFPGCFVGTDAAGAVPFTGTLTPHGSDYLLGGGKTAWVSSPNSGLVFSNLSDAPDTAPRRAVIGREGLVGLDPGNTHSGGTLVTNRAALFLASDGLGAIPAAFDPGNLTLNGGILRSGSAHFALPATRGVFVGPAGAEFHPWGTYTLTLLGSLSGTGPARLTDGGSVIAAGAANAYNGTVTIQHNGATFGIGNGDAFSWASSGGITNSGSLALNNHADATFADTVYGNGRIRKRGNGTLTLTSAHPFTGMTLVEAGALRFSGNGSLRNSAAFVNNGEVVVANDTAAGLSQLVGKEYAGTGSIRLEGEGSGLLMDDACPIQGGLATGPGTTLSASAPGTLGTGGITLGGGTLALAAAGATSASGFGPDWTLNGPACLPVSTNDTTWLQVTDNAGNRASSAFLTNRVQTAGAWRAEFDYYVGPKSSDPADGFAFVLHNDPRGVSALGGAGSSLGASGLTPSFGININLYHDDSIGWIVDGGRIGNVANIFGTANGVQDGDVHFVVEYDGTRVSLTASKSDKTYTASYTTDLVSALGGTAAYLGFSGGTGGSTAQQLIGGFTFTTLSRHVPLQPLGDTAWQRNGAAAYADENGETVLRLTPNEGSKTASFFHKQKIYINQPFAVSFRYRVGANSGNPADGATVVFHNGSLTYLGGNGSAVAYDGLTPSVGWKFDIYNNNKPGNDALVWLTAGTQSTRHEVLAPNGILLDNQIPVDVSIIYDLTKLTLTLAQNGNTVSVDSPAVNLSETLGAPYAYFGFTGATGGQTAEQFVSQMALVSGLPRVGGAVYGNPVTVTGEAASTLAVAVRPDAPNVTVDTLTLETGADLTVAAAAGSAADTAYRLTVNSVWVNGPGTSILVTGNGTGTGTFVLGGAVHLTADAYLTLQGAFAAGGKVQLVVPDLGPGSHAVIDLHLATGLAVSDFELISPMSGAVLRIRNGILYVIKDTGAILTIK
jgi:autotransporter-associated beta strand protein